MKTYTSGHSGLAKGLLIFYGVSAAIALLQVILAFVQTTHYLGFFSALILLGGSCFMFYFTMILSRKDEIHNRKTLITIISI